MLKLYSILPAILAISISAGAQQTSSGNNFSLEIPSYWKKEGKTWQMLAERLASVCPELEGKNVCADCNEPEFKVVWLMSEPLVVAQDVKELTNNSPTINNSVRRATSNGRSLNGKDSIVVSPSFANSRSQDYTIRWQIRTYYTFEFSLLLLDSKDSILRRIVLVDADELQVRPFELVSNTFTETNPIMPANFIGQYQDRLLPGQFDQFLIIDRKLSALK